MIDTQRRGMVLYYTPRDNSYKVYVGKDKYENEDLLKHGWEEDVWFHVDKLSSAHVYLRLQEGDSLDKIPSGVLEDCAQLVKYNSIEGNKQSNVAVVYTMWSNLKKTGDMAIGQVSFHNNRAVRRITVEKRINEIINRLNKTKREGYPDLGAEKREHLRKLANAKKEKERNERKKAIALAEQRRKEKEARSYDSIHTSSAMTSNKDFRQDATEFEDGFM